MVLGYQTCLTIGNFGIKLSHLQVSERPGSRRSRAAQGPVLAAEGFGAELDIRSQRRCHHHPASQVPLAVALWSPWIELHPTSSNYQYIQLQPVILKQTPKRILNSALSRARILLWRQTCHFKPSIYGVLQTPGEESRHQCLMQQDP